MTGDFVCELTHDKNIRENNELVSFIFVQFATSDFTGPFCLSPDQVPEVCRPVLSRHVTRCCMSGQLTATGPARRSALCTVQYANTGEGEEGARVCVCVCDEFPSEKLLVAREQFVVLLFDFLSAEQHISQV